MRGWVTFDANDGYDDDGDERSDACCCCYGDGGHYDWIRI